MCSECDNGLSTPLLSAGQISLMRLTYVFTILIGFFTMEMFVYYWVNFQNIIKLFFELFLLCTQFDVGL